MTEFDTCPPRLGKIVVPCSHPACHSKDNAETLRLLDCPPDTTVTSVSPHISFMQNLCSFTISHPALPEAWSTEGIFTVIPKWLDGFSERYFTGWEIIS